MSRALPPRGSITPSRRSTLSLFESSKGPNCRFLSTPSAMALNTDLVHLSGLLNHQRKTQARPCSTFACFGSPRSLAQSDQHAATGMRDAYSRTMPSASLSLTEIVHFRHCLYPPNGGRTDVCRGSP